MRVLTVTGDVPWPPVGGARTRNAHLAEALAEQHEVVVAALDWGGARADAPPGVALHAVAHELPPLHAALEAGNAEAWELLAALDEPYGVAYYANPGLEELIGRLCAQVRPDVAVLTETAVARFRSWLPPDLPFVLDLHDVQALKQARHGEDEQAARLRAFESAAAAAAAVTVCVSPLEASAARDVLAAERVEVVPNGVDTRRFRPASGPGDDDRLVFTGSLHTRENVEAMVWFVEDVLPKVREQRPGVVLDVVGARPADAVRRLACATVRVHADVPDTLPFLHDAGVAVVPLLHGGGTRLKVLEAAAAGRSVVTTTVGVEGLPLADGEHLLVGDDVQSFADAVVRLCADPAERLRLAAAAAEAAAPFDWRVLGRRWRAIVERAAER